MKEEKVLKIFGFDVSHLPRFVILIIGVVGILVSFLVQGTSQEMMYSTYNYKQSIFFTFNQFFCYFLLSSSYFIRLIRGKEKLHASIKYYSFVSFMLVGSMLLSNWSIELLAYSTSILFKASKLIPVMIGSVIFLRKRYNFFEVLSVILVVFGLYGISMSDKKVKNKFDPLGVVLMVISLCCDAISSSLQEKALDQFNAPQVEVISMMYLIGSIYLFILSLLTGQFFRAVTLAYQHPDMIFYLLSFGFLGGIGVQFVYLIMKAFGSLVTVMVTSCRKALTFTLSFILFPDKKFTVFHLISVAAIATGVSLNYYGKSLHKKTNIKALDNVSKENNDGPENIV